MEGRTGWKSVGATSIRALAKEIDQSHLNTSFHRGYVHLKSYLRSSLAKNASLSKEQSCPPNPLLQEHDAEHVTVGIVQLYRLFPEGSEYLQAPFPEHTVPDIVER